MATTPNLLSVAKIWDQGAHNAFTDLLRFDDRWWCTFREAEEHGPSIGTVRVITSEDGADWQSVAVLEEQEVDLRDPKLSVTPDGRLMLVMGGCVYGSGEHGTRSPRIAFSSDGINWTAPQKVLAEDHWLWRVTWHEGVAYSVSKLGEGANPRRGFLYSSTDGLDWRWISELFLPDDTWSDGTLWAAARGRHPEGGAAMVLSRMTRTNYKPVLWLPSDKELVVLGATVDGHGWVNTYAPNGKELVELGATVGGKGMVTTHAPNGKELVELGATVGGKGMVTTYASKVIPSIKVDDQSKFRSGELTLDQLTRIYIHERFEYQYCIVETSREAFDLESSCKAGDVFGEVPKLNPL